MEESTSAGPVQIVTITEDHKFVLDEKKLKKILFHKQAVGKKVFYIIKKFEKKDKFMSMLDFTGINCR